MHLYKDICDGGMCKYLMSSLMSCLPRCGAVIYPYFVLLGSESSTVEIHISSELRDYDDVDADGESLENSVRH